MENPTSEEDIPLINQDENYDDYKTPDIIRVYDTSFTLPDTTEVTSTLQLRWEVKRDKLTVLYRHLNLVGHPDLNLDRFR